MSEQVAITVDGREIVATEGQMLVDAAKHGDVEIPVFCYEPKLGPPVGACRMCLVEIEGIPKLQTACSTPVRDGMVVHTKTEQVHEAQNAVVEFLLVNHPLDCPVCDKGGECPLQDISMGWGPGRSRFTDPKRHFEKPLPLSPLVAIDRERCILCYRCVRFSQEVSEDAQLQLLDRGSDSYVGTFDDRPYIAPFHGNITELCPVGALTSYTYRFRARPWDIEEGGSVCTHCPSQCNVKFTIRDEQVNRVLARDNEEVDDGWVCDRGRYGFEMWNGEERLTTPLVREGGALRPASWGEALDRAAAGLRETGAATATLVGDASNEEGHLLARLTREALGSADLDSRLAAAPTPAQLVALATPAISARVKDLDAASAILVLGTDPLNSAPILDLRVRKAVRRNGAKLLIATDRPTALDGGSLAGARYAPGQAGTWTAALATALKGSGPLATSPTLGGSGDSPLDAVSAIGSPVVLDASRAEMLSVSGTAPGPPSASAADASGQGVPDGVADVAEVLREAERVVVLWGERIAGDAGGVDAVLALSEALGLAGKDGSGLLGVPETGNGRGLREVGVLPDAGPGLAPLGASATAAGAAGAGGEAAGRGAEEIRAALEADELEGLILFGVDPLRDAPGTAAWKSALAASNFTVAFSMFANDSTAAANVVFPLESPAEKEGTVTHMDGRLQRVRPNAKRPGDVRAVWQVLAELNAMLGNETGISSAPEALAAVAASVPFYAGITAEEIGGRGVRWQDRPQADSFDAGNGAGDASRDAVSPTDATAVPGDDRGEMLSVPGITPDADLHSDPAPGDRLDPDAAAEAKEGGASREVDSDALASSGEGGGGADPGEQADAPGPSEEGGTGAEGGPGAVPETLSISAREASGTAASSIAETASRGLPPDPPRVGENHLLLGTYRDLWAGPVTEHNPALAFLKPGQRVELAPADAQRLGLEQGDNVEVAENGSKLMARVLIRERMLPGAAFMVEATADNNANQLAGPGKVAAVQISKVTPPVQLEVQKVASP